MSYIHKMLESKGIKDVKHYAQFCIELQSKGRDIKSLFDRNIIKESLTQ